MSKDDELLGTFVDLHGYYYLWFPVDRAEGVLRALTRFQGPIRVESDQEPGRKRIEVLNIHAARWWSLREQDYWPTVERGQILTLTLEPDDEAPEATLRLLEGQEVKIVRFAFEEALRCIHATASEENGQED